MKPRSGSSLGRSTACSEGAKRVWEGRRSLRRGKKGGFLLKERKKMREEKKESANRLEHLEPPSRNKIPNRGLQEFVEKKERGKFSTNA